MQWILFVLILMGQASFFTCRHYKYHFVKQKKNWTEAQTYCRDKYTDLATVLDMTDMKRLCDSAQKPDEAWIGLYSDPELNYKNMWRWQWSLPGLEFNDSESKWGYTEPNNYDQQEKCVRMDTDGMWQDDNCSKRHKFICYNGKNTGTEKFNVNNKTLTWPEAQKYCREHHTDLISGREQLDELNAAMTPYPFVWIGLFRDSRRWSDESSFSFRNLDPHFNRGDGCAVTTLQPEGRWKYEDCNAKRPFICYEDKVILITENKTWEDALEYCRDKHSQLVSITSRNEQLWVQERVQNASSPFVWLGLRYTCTLDFWFWVSNEVVRYKNWDSDKETDDCDMSGAMDRGGQHKWFRKFDNETFNFMCYK
ncbi:macrophage mannose receptor 1-like [Plectropomus leopardus]|uniref:macrophage mannose receptor 1-like n=1 Tax=Plectropomus leopardus TaxID=160734 RepID=UPI001C4BC9C0|nr:macrophage mannose receptor 1-like [Plectropomus leopardus]